MIDGLERLPEPELMDSPAQVRAYADADFAESNQWFADRLAGRLASSAEGPGRIADLGCGPGDICMRAARALPGWAIVGIDAGPNMLDAARERIRRAGLSDRIELRLARLPADLDAEPFDCVMSNSLLHHLPDPGILWRSVVALGRPGTRVQVMDLERPATAAASEALVDRYAAGQPDVLRADFRNSLQAAWRLEEVRRQLRDAGLALDCERVSDRHWLVSGRLERC